MMFLTSIVFCRNRWPSPAFSSNVKSHSMSRLCPLSSFTAMIKSFTLVNLWSEDAGCGILLTGGAVAFLITTLQYKIPQERESTTMAKAEYHSHRGTNDALGFALFSSSISVGSSTKDLA